MRTAGIEPACLAAKDFKSLASTGFATSAWGSAFNHTFARKSNSPTGGARAAAFRILLDDRYFGPVDGDGDRADQNRAENNVLGKDIDAEEGHADAHH